MSVSPLRPAAGRLPWPLLFLYLAIALMLTQMHAYEVNFGPKQEQREIRHNRILAGRGEAPWAHRVLMPALAEAGARPLEAVLGRREAREGAYLALQFAAIFGFLAIFDRFQRTWLPPAWAVAGTLFAAALHPITYRFYWYQPDSPTDLFAWALGGWLTVTGRDAWLLPLVALATLNRETAVFIPVMYVALRWNDPARDRMFLRAAGMFVCWLVPFLGIRSLVGERRWTVDIAEVMRDNLQPSWILYAGAFLLPLVTLPWIGWSRRPPELRRLALALLATYLPLQFVFGRIREVRLLLPLAVALVPLAMLALRDATDPPAEKG